MSRSAYHAAGRSVQTSASLSPRSTTFESGGREYGRWTSSPTRTIRPSNPPARRVPAATEPASPPPTITNVGRFTSPSPLEDRLACSPSPRPILADLGWMSPPVATVPGDDDHTFATFASYWSDSGTDHLGDIRRGWRGRRTAPGAATRSALRRSAPQPARSVAGGEQGADHEGGARRSTAEPLVGGPAPAGHGLEHSRVA